MADTGRDLQTRELMDAMKELRLTIESLRKELSARDKLIENLQEQIAYLQKKLFGTSSEKRSIVVEGQLGLFDEVEMEAAKETDPEPDTEEETVVFTAAKTRKAVLSTFMRKIVCRQRKKRVVMQWRNRRERPPGASCSCTSCCPTGCLRHGAGGRRRASARSCRRGRCPQHGCACGSRG